jgi:aminopeptidase N
VKTDLAKTIYLKDYQSPFYLIDKVDLHVDLFDQHTLVTAKLWLRLNPKGVDQSPGFLRLDGEQLELMSIAVDEQTLDKQQYQQTEESLTLLQPTAEFVLTTQVRIKPQQNTSLEGLYCSNGMFCTQCEAEGFRKITYYLDRPDVMAAFTTTIVADKTKYPVLLANGNLLASGDETNGRHWATWQDPFKKPAYLFALVAGDLAVKEDSFTTCSGRQVTLKMFVEPEDLDQCDHAMASLKKAMAWDEQLYGREYDLDIFMIVAVGHFNMGAMENKGLNIFNTACVLANPKTATDAAFQRVESVVAHEYFHNWSGNRVTCRDWFQLSLKEGFTVFREHQFAAAMNSPTVNRIANVRLLRAMQFPEDGGPMAHPVRPASYMEISNFYTMTVYEKGAEVVCMLHTLVGAEGFRRGTDLYFSRHDGQAVTTHDFVQAIADANQLGSEQINQFSLWYSQAGTPTVKVTGHYDNAQQRYTLEVEQSCPATPEVKVKQPFYIPLRVALLNARGQELELQLAGESAGSVSKERVLVVNQQRQQFTFQQVPEEPVPSLLRGFSAPVKLHFAYSQSQRLFLMQHDQDGFNRWEAGQQLSVEVMLDLIKCHQADQQLQLAEDFTSAYRTLLTDASLGKALLAEMLQLPTEAYLAELITPVDVVAIYQVREFIKQQLAEQLEEHFVQLYQASQDTEPYHFNAQAVAQRQLKNTALSYLVRLARADYTRYAEQQFYHASHMTDQQAALLALAQSNATQQQAKRALAYYYQSWQQQPLIVDQWFSIQASVVGEETLARVRQLLDHPEFDLTNPNRVRALIGSFCRTPMNLHQLSGDGYTFLAQQVLSLDKLNPQIAARLLTPLTHWRRYDKTRQSLMKTELERIQASSNLSKDVYEIVAKSI